MIDGEIWDEEYKHLIVKLYDNCDICKRFHKTPATPVVCLPLDTDFNDVVAMDLKSWKSGYYILYLICSAIYQSHVYVDRHRPGCSTKIFS